MEVGVAAGGAAHDGAEVGAVERCSGDEFAQDVAEEADSYGEKFGEQGALGRAGAVGVVNLEAAHIVGGPELPGFEVVGSHASAILEFGGEFVEEVGVDPDAGGDDEVAGGGLAVEVFVLDAAKGNAAEGSGDGGFGGVAGAKRDAEVVSESVGGAEGENGESDGGAGESLNDVVDGAIAAAGEDGVAASGNGAAGVVGGFVAGAADGEFGADSGGLDDADGVVEFGVALFAAAAGVGIEEDSGSAHASAGSALSSALVGFPFSVLVSLLSLTHAPLPHAEHRFLWDRVSSLTGEHGDLSAMMSVVRDQVAEEAGGVRTKALNAAIAIEGEGRLEDGAQRGSAGVESSLCLGRRDGEAVELLGDLSFCSFQPHDADVVHVRNHGGDVASFVCGRFGTPGFGGQMVEQILVDAVVGIEGREQSFGENEGRG